MCELHVAFFSWFQFLNAFFPVVVLNPGNVINIAGRIIGEASLRSENLFDLRVSGLFFGTKTYFFQ